MPLGPLLFALAAQAQTPMVLDEAGNPRLDWQSLPLLDLRLPGEVDAEAIVNGTPTSDHPEVVALVAMSNWGGYVFCSGTLIDPEYVLSAAHCVVEIPGMEAQGQDVYVFFGGDLLGVGATDTRRVDQWAAHPNYNASTIANDIGIVHLESPKTGVDLAVLNDEAPDGSWVGQDMTFLGFGITSDNANDAGVKRTTDIAVDGWDANFIYSYTPGTNLCSGDSGGAAFENTAAGTQELAGVNSWVSPGCVGGSNGVTRVDQHIGWIQGYAPNVLLGGDGAGSNPGGGTGTGGGGGGGGAGLGAGDPSAYDRDLGTAIRPSKGDYPVGVGCATAPGPGSALGLGGLLLLLGRRSRGRA